MKKLLVLLIILFSWGVMGESVKNKNNTVTIYFARH